jgi:hypothetical protein
MPFAFPGCVSGRLRSLRFGILVSIGVNIAITLIVIVRAAKPSKTRLANSHPPIPILELGHNFSHYFLDFTLRYI